MKSKPLIDLTGQQFGRLTALSFDQGKWLCHCECGGTVREYTAKLRNGHRKTCGCSRNGSNSTFKSEGRTHRHLKQRCLNPKDAAYHLYGGRGITVCDRWQGPDGFRNFLTDMGPRPSPEHSIDRHPDKDGPYSPENCRWATPVQQVRNRRVTRTLTFQGVTQPLTTWAETYSLSDKLVRKRLDVYGWSVKKALTYPVAKRGEKLSWATLTEAQVRKIKYRKEWPPGSKAKAARELGVSPATISGILNGSTWSHI